MHPGELSGGIQQAIGRLVPGVSHLQRLGLTCRNADAIPQPLLGNRSLQLVNISHLPPSLPTMASQPLQDQAVRITLFGQPMDVLPFWDLPCLQLCR